MESGKRLKHIIQKYPEVMLPLTSNLSAQTTKFDRLVRRSMERSSRYHSRRIYKPSRRLSQLVIDEALKCVVCSQVFQVPVTLECGDTFCRECLPKTMSSCPQCGRGVGAEDVKCNVLVQEIVSRIRQGQDENQIKNSVPNISHKYKLRKRDENMNIVKVANKPFRASVKRKHEEIESAASNQLARCTIDVSNNARVITTAAADNKDSQEKHHLSAPLITPSDVDCVLCGRCLFEPATTICGHTFCRPCLARVLDYGLACPLCMSRLVSGNDASSAVGGICKSLDTVIKRLLPGEHAERLEVNREEIQAVDEDLQIPVFICTSAFPGVACPLYVYEPRYRLLTRRCLQTNRRRFAMAAAVAPSTTLNNTTGEDTLNENGRFASYGTVLEVHDAVHLQDGTSILTTVGLRRFRVLARDEKDGYDTATIEYIHDSPVPIHQVSLLRSLHDRVHRKAVRWVRSLASPIHAEIEQSLGAMPTLETNWAALPDGPAWAWWLMPVLPLSAHLQLGFLSTCSLEKRLRAIDKLLDRMSVKMRARERADVTGRVAVEEESENDSCAHASRHHQEFSSAHAHDMEF